MLRFAFRNLMSRPVRSILALLGLTVAIAGMVGLFSIATGIDDTVGSTFGRIPGLAAMQPGAPIPLFSRMPMSWSDEIARLPGVRTARPEVWARAQLVEGKPTFSPPRFLFGTDIERTVNLKQAVYRDDIISGRFLSVDDVGTMNCVVSRTIAQAFHKQVGDRLRIDGFDLTIVGIYHCGSLLLDVAIVLDAAGVRRISKFDDGLISSVYVEPDDTIPKSELMEEIRKHFRGRRADDWRNNTAKAFPEMAALQMLNSAAKLLTTEPKPSSASTTDSSPLPQSSAGGASEPQIEEAIEVRSAQDWGDKIAELSSDLDVFLYLMTGIGVIIALLSILNTMLMSVAERLIEFGVLKANGWSAWDVMRLITWESALLGLGGGILGCGVGWVAVQIVNAIFPTKLHLVASSGLLLFSLIFSTLLGMLGGVYPAIWALKMSPMEAIRRG
ncbi:ABC transporter permease [Schlesneria paludicola]|uniref:ABC transporter permease n=1 Tax=Schlesneria paludicola TaxID=360056 RepID=UPI00029B4EB7|nr:ABC transporter permease [Schlesneria paludicola]